MKLGIVSDIHEDYESLEKALDFLSTKNLDHLIIPGDFVLKPYTKEDYKELQETENEQYFLNKILSNMKNTFTESRKILDKSQLPYYLVPGNYDGINIDEIFKDKNIDGKKQNINGLTIFGYGGADAYAPHMSFLSEFITSYDHNKLGWLLEDKNPNIVLLHNPPYKLCDDMYDGRNVGTPAVKTYLTDKMKENKGEEPKLVIAGHIHEAGPTGKNPNGVKGVQRFGNTVIVNPGNVGRFGLFEFGTLKPIIPMDKLEYGTFSEVDINSNGSVEKVTHYSVKNPEKKNNEIKKLEEIVF